MSNSELICPLCECGVLTARTYTDTFQHHGIDLTVDDLEGYLCAACGADPIFEDQIRRNHLRVVDARRRADGLLTGKEIRALRERLGLTQKEASEVFGGGAHAFSKYERGEVVQSAPMDRLLRLVDRYPPLLKDLPGGKAVCELLPAHEVSEYVNGDTIQIKPRKLSGGLCLGTATIIELDEWKESRNYQQAKAA